MSSSRGARRRLALPTLALVGLVAALPALLVTGCGKPSERALLTTGSRRMTLDDFYEYARDPQVTARYMMLPDSLQKKSLFEDIESYQLLAEAGAQAGYAKDSAYVHLDDQVLPHLLQDALYDKHIGSVLKVSEDEARIFYESPKLEYRLAVIMVADTNSARGALQRLDRGETFANVAKTVSMDPGTNQNGGAIEGWLALMQLSPTAEAAITPLTKGEHTRAIIDRTGVYVFEVLDTRPRKITAPFAQVKAQMIEMLESRKKGALVDGYIANLKSHANLKVDGPGWPVVEEKLVTMPDSLSRLLGTDNARAGLTPDDQKAVLASWNARTYTVADLAKDLAAAAPNERPSPSHTESFRSFVEGKAITDILVAQAKQEGIDKTPAIERQLERAKSAYLVNKYIAQAIPPSAIGQPSPAVLDSVTHALVSASMKNGMSAAGAAANIPITYAALPPQVQEQVLNDWRQKRQQAVLKAEVARVKTRIPPVVDQKLYDSIPWPVPAAGRKENA